MRPVVQYDAAANTAYIRFSGKDVRKSEEVSDSIVFDYDETGRIVGMEILDARAHLPPTLLNDAA